MAIFKNANFDERRNAAEAAKKAKLEKFRALTAQISEGAAERGATRQAIVAARDVRAAEREAARLANEARSAEDQAAREIFQKLPTAIFGARIRAMRLISGLPLSGSAISESMQAWIACCGVDYRVDKLQLIDRHGREDERI
jgi:hypothetical protein